MPISIGLKGFPNSFLEPPQHCTFCMSPLSITPDSTHQLISSNSKTWNRCVRQRRHAKCAVLGRLQERVWEPLNHIGPWQWRFHFHLKSYWSIFNITWVTGMQTLKNENVWHTEKYVLCNCFDRGEQDTFLVSILFVLQIFFFEYSRYQLYAKLSTFVFWPLKMCRI